MANWYYFQNGEQQGPVDFSALRQMAANGELTADDQVWQEETPDWVAASQVPGLIVSQPAPQQRTGTSARPTSRAKQPAAVGKGQLKLLAGIAIAIVLLGAGVLVLWIVKNNQDNKPPVVHAQPAEPVDNDSVAQADTGGLAKRIAAKGMKALQGDGVPQDANKAVQLLSQAGELGDPDAALMAAKMYANGQGTKKDDVRAFKFYSKAADKGNAEAMNAVASSYEHGTGVAADPTAAKTWHEKAAAAGYKAP